MDDGEMLDICYRIELKDALENRFKVHILTALNVLGNNYVSADRIYDFLYRNYRDTDKYSYYEMKVMLKKMVKHEELLQNKIGYKSVSLDMLEI